MSTLSEYARFLAALPSFSRRPQITARRAQAAVRERIATREERFIEVLSRAVYETPSSPYRQLLRLARCELGDLEREISRHGLEQTLRSLHDAGVYLTFEEFKGLEPIVRQGHEVVADPTDLDSPFLRRVHTLGTGGSTGPALSVHYDLEYLESVAVNFSVAYDAYGLHGVPFALWRHSLPGDGLPVALVDLRTGNPVRAWFTPETKSSWRTRASIRGAVMVVRAARRPMPYPTTVPLDAVLPVARWAHDACRAHGRCVVRGPVSLVFRVCLAALDEGIDLGGVTFVCGSEPPTSGKVRVIRSTGAGFVPTYFITELGVVGLGCANPVDENDLHFQSDLMAMVQVDRNVPGSERTVSTFSFTTLDIHAPKIALNVCGDDYGVVEERSCGCVFEELGLGPHIREVRSYKKLTAEGVTLVGTDVERVLDSVLPARFGGSAVDYQLLEEEDDSGLTRLSVLVSPRVGPVDEHAILDEIRNALRATDRAGVATANIWDAAGTLRVRRAEPVWTDRGKFLPLRRGERSRDEKR